jgi:predicted GIY-YIG superfamily endonuclease
MVYQHGAVTSDYTRRAWKELLKNLEGFQKQANVVRNYIHTAKDKEAALDRVAKLKDWAWKAAGSEGMIMRARGAEKAAIAVRQAQSLAEEMAHTYASDAIGGAMDFYIDEGILLADVHANNVGVVTRPPDENYDDWHGINVITDPGHMVPLDPKWLNVRIKKI